MLQLITPDSFILAVVAKGLTWQLARAVIRTSLRELAHSLPLDAELKISIN